MTVRVLCFEGCPNAQPALDLVRSVVRDVRPDTNETIDVQYVRVLDPDDADRLDFFGSPSVQVDGKGIEPARRSDRPTFGCRLYRDEGKASPVPPREMIIEAIAGALAAGT